MMFKIGDKVKVVKSEDFPDMVGKICKVLTVQPSNSLFACRIIESKGDFSPLMYDYEIEKVSAKGEQLLFSFMSEVE